MADDEAKAQRERARSLREEIGRLAAGRPKRRPPRSPHEFVEERMAEEAPKPEDEGVERDDESSHER
ncbi:MAG: hypothetical protein ACM3N0_05140 [Chloroflexota bacterium]